VGGETLLNCRGYVSIDRIGISMYRILAIRLDSLVKEITIGDPYPLCYTVNYSIDI
jgi:hypothetical protein